MHPLHYGKANEMSAFNGIVHKRWEELMCLQNRDMHGLSEMNAHSIIVIITAQHLILKSALLPGKKESNSINGQIG